MNNPFIHPDKPVLATFILYAYNEEKFIREAILSAFTQTYTPLEIVLSDDGSADRTFAIMEEMAASYQGPHRIILNRNAANTGIGSQLNAAVQKTTGGLILLANGDDRSRPERVMKTVEAWRSTGCSASCLVSPLDMINEKGVPLPGKQIPNNTYFDTLLSGMHARFGGVGAAASAAYRREVFTFFPPLLPELILEDNPLYMRAMLLGETIYIKEALVEYRMHEQNISQAYALAPYPEWKIRHYSACAWQRSEAVKAYGQMLADLHSLKKRKIEQDLPPDLEASRFTAIGKQLENELFRQYYDKQSSLSVTFRWRLLLLLFWLEFKITLKRLFPFIEERNVRAQYLRNKSHWGEA
jgi:glycosyltransferase involved in cell wall biosynthesis